MDMKNKSFIKDFTYSVATSVYHECLHNIDA